MPRLIPQLESHVIGQCGHWLQCEQPEAVNRLLMDFLARHYHG
jgi:pimeloyl-ACP methyl ester carboxylesterase